MTYDIVNIFFFLAKMTLNYTVIMPLCVRLPADGDVPLFARTRDNLLARRENEKRQEVMSLAISNNKAQSHTEAK